LYVDILNNVRIKNNKKWFALKCTIKTVACGNYCKLNASKEKRRLRKKGLDDGGEGGRQEARFI